MSHISLYRHRFIELLSYWEGHINAPIIARQFSISNTQARDAIKTYQVKWPKNLVYDSSLKAYVPTVAFTPSLILDGVEEYLIWLSTGCIQTNEQTFVHLLTLPERKISPRVMRALTKAVKQKRRVDVDYISLNNPNGDGRVIVPHSFVRTGHRWHLRAYCEKSQQYRDFVLSRFRGTPELMLASDNTMAGDTGWNTLVDIHLQADIRLNENKRRVIEQDFQMTDGKFTLQTRACLVHYILRELQISIKTLDVLPEAQQLICTNLQALKPWLFEG